MTRALGLASLVAGLLAGATDASACRRYVPPETHLANAIAGPYEVIALATVVEVRTFEAGDYPSWEARATLSRPVQGAPAHDAFELTGFGGAGLCFYVRPPAIGEVWVVYLARNGDTGAAFAYPLAEMIDRDWRLRAG